MQYETDTPDPTVTQYETVPPSSASTEYQTVPSGPGFMQYQAVLSDPTVMYQYNTHYSQNLPVATIKPMQQQSQQQSIFPAPEVSISFCNSRLPFLIKIFDFNACILDI